MKPPPPALRPVAEAEATDRATVHGRKVVTIDVPDLLAGWVKQQATTRRLGMGDLLIEAIEDHDTEIAERIQHRPTIGGKRFTARPLRAAVSDLADEPKRTITMRFGPDDWVTLLAIEQEMQAESMAHLVRTALTISMEHRTQGESR